MTELGSSIKSILVISLIAIEMIAVSTAASGIDVSGSTIVKNQAQYHFPVAPKEAGITAKIGKGLNPMPREAISFKFRIKGTIVDYYGQLDTALLFDPVAVGYNTTCASQLESKRAKLEGEIVVLTDWQGMLAKTLSSAADESDYIEVGTQISELEGEVPPGDDKCLYHCILKFPAYKNQ